MAKMTLEDLRKLRESKRQQMDMRSPDNKTADIIVSMGTSGIAAGAKDTLKAFVEELESQGLTNVAVRQVGGMGLEHAEPTVEVRVPDMPRVIYGTVDADVARAIVRRHVMGKELVNEHIFDRPAADIVEDGKQGE
ncbi:MAG TPA: (2Fe-2S) ferredoxin domain-containing protein [Alkalispirochaeta sp.]|nr:(2Fe-2S) ferredoxin domain-containing protein [Alkalispirochaeta sp.]